MTSAPLVTVHSARFASTFTWAALSLMTYGLFSSNVENQGKCSNCFCSPSSFVQVMLAGHNCAWMSGFVRLISWCHFSASWLYTQQMFSPLYPAML
jgi:hypothetical protein